jgi:hypothetical protein
MLMLTTPENGEVGRFRVDPVGRRIGVERRQR